MGTVWDDVNGDGKQDAKENVLRNVALELYDKKFNKIQTVKSNKNGQYTFKNLLKGVYHLKVIPSKSQRSVTPQSIEIWLDKDRRAINFALATKII